MIQQIGGHELAYSKLLVRRLVPETDAVMSMDGKDGQGACKAAVERLASRPYWLAAGTLLGLVRDGDAIEGDSDIDICIDAEWDDPPDHDELKSAFAGDEYVALYEMLYDNRLVQVMFLDKARDVYVDVFYCYRGFEPGRSWWFAQAPSIRVDERFIINRCEQETVWGRFVLPHPVEEYLECHYGQNWRTPEGRKGSWWQAESRVPW